MHWDLLHIITKLELGGAQLATLYEISHSQFACGKRYLAYGPGGMLDAEAQSLTNVECFVIDSLHREIELFADLKAIFTIAQLVRKLKRRSKDARLLVNTHSSKAGVIGRLGGWLGGADAIVHSIHGFGHSHHGSQPARKISLAAEKLASKVTDGFTADSYANINEAKRDRILTNQRNCVVRCGIEIDKYSINPGDREQVRSSLNISHNVPVILTLACFKPQKGLQTLIKVAAQVVQKRADAIFLLAGDGELRLQLTELIAQHQLTNNVFMLGWRHDIVNLLYASDIFLLTSLWEGLPQVFMLAMAARMPIVATDVDGNSEAITHGENGFLCAAGDVQKLAQAVEKLINDSTLRKQMGECGFKQCQQFSVEKMIADLDEFYQKVTYAC